MIVTAGDAQGFTDTYLEGLALQYQSQRTVGMDTQVTFLNRSYRMNYS